MHKMDVVKNANEDNLLGFEIRVKLARFYDEVGGILFESFEAWVNFKDSVQLADFLVKNFIHVLSPKDQKVIPDRFFVICTTFQTWNRNLDIHCCLIKNTQCT